MASSQEEVGARLEDCLRASAAPQPSQSTEDEARRTYCRYRGSLCVELAGLLQEAVEMKWPFVPEKWQYKQSVSPQDKTNLTDLISQHLPQLLALLKLSILAQEGRSALAVIFLVDRFLYWTDESHRLLKITKLLHRHHPEAPVAPQLVIRQARVYLNSGKLQKAEYILSSLINNSGATGCWLYHSESDRALVQAVSVQVRGLVLQKLGLWLEAAELIWASLVGFYALPLPDKKGIGTSLGLLANILVSMNDDDFRAFKTNPYIDLSLLGDPGHRLLFAVEAAKMSVVYSQYASLYVLTNVVTQGACLLSYSFSVDCPSSESHAFLQRAREAFEVGLLTKGEAEPVTSRQELHTFLKAAYSLTVTHKWLGGTPVGVLLKATQACQEGLALFYDYCHADDQERDGLCAEIMRRVTLVKTLLRVEPFPNSDKGSFIPDSYRDVKERAGTFTLGVFAGVMVKFQKHLASVCEATSTNCKHERREGAAPRLCITALGTTIGTLGAECATEDCKGLKDRLKGDELQEKVQNPSAPPCPCREQELCTTLSSTDGLGSSWQNFSLSGSASPRPSASGHTGGSICSEENKDSVCDQSCLTTEVSEDDSNSREELTGENGKQTRGDAGVSSHAVPGASKHVASSSDTGSDQQFEVIEGEIETVGTEEGWVTDAGPLNMSGTGGAIQSLSQLSLGEFSLTNSFGTQSLCEKISANPQFPANNSNPQLTVQSELGTKLLESTEACCFSLMETIDSTASNSAAEHKHPAGLTSGGEIQSLSKRQPLCTFDADPNAETETEPLPLRPETVSKDHHTPPQSNLRQSVSQYASTKTSPESSFEMVEKGEFGCSDTKIVSMAKLNGLDEKNPSCYSCLKHSIVGRAASKGQYVLTRQDYDALFAGVCHGCLLKRLQSDTTEFKLNKYRNAHSALHLKFSRATGLWTSRETCVYIGEPMGIQGKQRMALWVQFLHQEERLSSYVGKDYLNPKGIQFHLNDVERQMTAQYYVTEFNKRLYEQEVTAQIFFIPSEVLLTLEEDKIVGCVTVEPYMLGDFVKLTNNKDKKDESLQATEYGIAFGHFTYQFSNCQEVVVDLQGWVTANGKGLTYLTDPQIHSRRTPMGPSNFADSGLWYFLEKQHGPECNAICHLLKLPPMGRLSH